MEIKMNKDERDALVAEALHNGENLQPDPTKASLRPAPWLKEIERKRALPERSFEKDHSIEECLARSNKMVGFMPLLEELYKRFPLSIGRESIDISLLPKPDPNMRERVKIVVVLNGKRRTIYADLKILQSKPLNEVVADVARVVFSEPPKSRFAHQHALDVDYEQARAVHRVVRALHDGECPKCHILHDSRLTGSSSGGNDYCPHCGFMISAEEKEAAMKLFAPIMEKNLEIFEKWRASRR